jgi:peptidoglycan/xylan/chitin deacetylase (PgdA/CDA1 family)
MDSDAQRRLGPRRASLWLEILCAATAAIVFAPATAGAWARHTPVPILVYHHVQGSLEGDYLAYVGTSQFAGQLRYLRSHGYHPVTIQQVWNDWTGKADLPRRPVVLSFDDGYVDQYSNAAHLLRRYRWPAVLNVVVHNGTALRDAQIRRMIGWGWEIGSHTSHHAILTRCSSATLRRELVDSRRALEQKYGVQVDFLCYPGGVYDARVMRAARDAGYLVATTIHYGAATPYGRYALPRIAVYWGESLSTFGSRMRQAVARAR